jgi:uncharacterized protein (TIGR02922 family)
MKPNSSQVTVIYYHDESLELQHEVTFFPINQNGRIVIPEVFKKGKSIIAVCEGQVKIINKMGDRILPLMDDV